jgi:hypothetical protein
VILVGGSKGHSELLGGGGVKWTLPFLTRGDPWIPLGTPSKQNEILHHIHKDCINKIYCILLLKRRDYSRMAKYVANKNVYLKHKNFLIKAPWTRRLVL